MDASATEKGLRSLVKRGGKPLKALAASDVLSLATTAWLEHAVDGLRLEHGDGLVAYFEVLDRGRGTLYEFGVNRVMVDAPEDDEYIPRLPAWKLRLSVAFKPTLQVFQLQPVVATVACWKKARASDFVREVQATPQFQLVREYEQRSSGIGLEQCDAPWGSPEHPTNGLSWAYP